MVYDCFPFFNELDILKLRLQIMDPYVDRFVIEEATVTFSGEPKELCFEKNRALFGAFLHKIDYIVVEDSPVRATTHERDNYQKNHLIRGLKALSEEDIIILSDVDEIPNPVALQEILREFDPDKIYHMAQRMFYCYLNMEEVSGKLLSITGEFEGIVQRQWLGSKVFSGKMIPDTGIIHIREADPGAGYSVRVADGGWHFGYMGGQGEKDVSRRIGVKVQAAAHQEYNNQDILSEAADKLVLGQDIFGREAEFRRVEIDESFPDYLREHQEEFDYLIMPPIGKSQREYTRVNLKAKRFFRKALRKTGRLYTQIAEKITMFQLAVSAMLLLILSLLPELYLTLVNRATGDDYGYGFLTRMAWIDTHSLIEVVRAAGETVRQYYGGWQGTWFSVFLFTMQPEVFHEKAYVIVTIVTLSAWVGITSLVLYGFLVKLAGFGKSSFVVVNALFLVAQIQFIPGIKSSVFWYNGIVHYMLPYIMCLLLAYWLTGYMRTLRIKYFWGILLLLGLLGGTNYQSALFAFILTVLFMTGAWLTRKNRKCFLLLLPLFVQAVGLWLSMTAPGNAIRAGEGFGFHVSEGVKTIALSFMEGIRQAGEYVIHKPLAMIGLLFMTVVIVYAQSHRNGESGHPRQTDQTQGSEAGHRFHYPYPAGFAALTFCIYCAMQSPELYAQVDVSLGVANINYQTFLCMILADGVYIGGWFKRTGRLRPVRLSGPVLQTAMVCLLLAIVCRSNIKETTAWQCMAYIADGQAADYKEQMELQTAILMDETIEDAVLPFINDFQGPLMHMPATADPEAWTNRVMRDFYGKKSVTAMDRGEWSLLYGMVGQK